MVLTGVLHVHTHHSDGTGSVDEVVEAAAGCGLDFIGINDHESLAARHDGWLGWHGGVFVLPGAELQDRRKNSHVLVYGIDELPRTQDTREQVSSVRGAGGLAIAAHPVERRGFLPGTRSYGWTLPVEGLDGVEVWNYMSMWKAGVTLANLRSRIAAPDLMLVPPLRESVDCWFSNGGCAVGGPDAHALMVGFGRFSSCVFPYRDLFLRLRTHLVLDPGHAAMDVLDESAFLDCLRRGRCFISNALLGDARGFRAGVRDGMLEMVLPDEARVRVYAPGSEVFEGDVGDSATVAVPSGVPLAIEVIRGGRTWIWCGLPSSCRSC